MKNSSLSPGNQTFILLFTYDPVPSYALAAPSPPPGFGPRPLPAAISFGKGGGLSVAAAECGPKNVTNTTRCKAKQYRANRLRLARVARMTLVTE